ncbi:TIGR01212 family radical SAM protein [Nitratifractor sp.]
MPHREGLEPLNTFGRYLKRRFGRKVRKVPVGLSGFTCPNIDGTVAKGGCTFCLNESFSPNLGKSSERITLNLQSRENPLLNKQLRELDEQFRGTSDFFRERYGIDRYLVYFQAFTNTYAPFETLKTLYDRALEYRGVVGLSIGTRSDSVTEETLEYLVELSRKHEIWIEYGIQSIYDETLERINRGHDALNVERAIRRAKELGLNVCGHLIFGLPGETKEMMLDSARAAYDWGVDSVKYHPLYVVKNTLLANEFRRGEFTPISFGEYLEVLGDALELKPPRVTVQRLTAGIDDDTLLAPEWCGWPKNRMMQGIRNELERRGIRL